MINTTHHKVYIVVFISEVLHQLLKALFLSTHLQKNHHVFAKLQLARQSMKNILKVAHPLAQNLSVQVSSLVKNALLRDKSSRGITGEQLHCKSKGSGTTIT